MKNSKNMIIATALTVVLGPVAGMYAMDAASVAKAMEAGKKSARMRLHRLRN